MVPTKFWFIWPSGFRGEELTKIDQSETRIAYGGHVPLKPFGQMYRNLVGSIYGKSSIKIADIVLFR
jgi:hypothetical protein